jgi:ABC-type uncharacterized transport system substrate-binding protein
MNLYNLKFKNYFFPIFLFLNLYLNSSIQSEKANSLETVPIEVLVSLDNFIYEQAIYGIENTIQSDIRITYLSQIEESTEGIQGYFQNLKLQKVPLIITIGNSATKLAIENSFDSNIVFSMVNSPKSYNFESKNICGVSMDISVQNFFTTLKEMNPNFYSVISLYSTKEGEFLAREGEYFDLKNNLNFKPLKVSNDSEFSSNINSIKSNVDAIYMVNDPIYNRNNFDALVNLSKEQNTVIMTSFPSLVKSGATFSISPDYTNAGVMTGEMVNRILHQNSICRKEGILEPTQTSFTLNSELLENKNLKIPASLIERAKLSDLLTAGINLLNDNKLKASIQVFDSIIKKDNNNQAAISYKSIAVDRLTGNKTRELMASAEQNFNSGRFNLARQDYQKVLLINPNISQAKEGVQKSLSAQSEQERLQGLNLFKNKKEYDGIRLILNSIRTFPSNVKSKTDLGNLRSQMISSLPDYFSKGVEEYDKREYESAIVIFENILLVQPDEKKAVEYLRLSYKKKEALQAITDKAKNYNLITPK